MHRKKLFVVLAELAVLSPVGGCAPTEELATTLRWNLGTEPPTLDPQLATDSTSIQCVRALYMG